MISIYRNTSDKRWGTATLPYHQRLFWLGPVFVLWQGWTPHDPIRWYMFRKKAWARRAY